MSGRVTVTAAVIEDGEGRVLIARRPDDAKLGGLWEFPGGKVEPGESAESCLARELHEEMNVRVSVGEHLMTVDDDPRLSLVVFSVQLLEGTPQQLWHAELRWVTREQLLGFEMPRADQPVVRRLCGTARS